MPNVMLTNYCNQACSYCFARERLEVTEATGICPPPELPRENLERLIELFGRWKVSQFRFIGGEPTLHPRFSEIIERVLAAGFPVHVFTNGVLRPDLVDFLAGQKNVNYLVNFNPPDFYQNQPGGFAAIEYFFEHCGKTIRIGTNIDRVEMDFGFLIEAIRRHHLGRIIRLGVANPICSFESAPKNHFLALEDYPRLASRLVELSWQLFDCGLIFSFDCCLPRCMFTPEQYGQIHLNGSAMPNGRCPSVVDIGTDLRMWRCFVTSGVFNDKLATDFASESQTRDYFDQRFRRLQQLGIYKKCLTCHQMEKGFCQGGCIAHVINRLQMDKQDLYRFDPERRACAPKAIS